MLIGAKKQENMSMRSLIRNPLVQFALGLGVTLIVAGLAFAASIESELQTAAVSAAPFASIIAIQWASKMID